MDIRKHYFLDEWVIFSPRRKERPFDFKNVKKNTISKKECVFCPKNSHKIEKELGHTGGDKSWEIKWFKNKFPAIDELLTFKNTKNINHEKKLQKYLESKQVYGFHEIIVETPHHTKQIYDFDKNKLFEVIKVYKLRYDNMINKKHIKYVSLFKNQGVKAGASIYHAHSQMIGLNKIPPDIIKKRKKSLKGDICEYCKIIDKEKQSERCCFKNKDFIAITPYASKFHYEIWILSKKHKTSFDFNEKELRNLSDILYNILKKIKKLKCDFNVLFQIDKKLHFHIEIIPRIDYFAGFEWSSGIIINTTLPESAAIFYKSK